MALVFTEKELAAINDIREVMIDEEGYWLNDDMRKLYDALSGIGVWVDCDKAAEWDIEHTTDGTQCYAALNPDYGTAVATRDGWRLMFDHLLADYNEFSEPASDALVSAAYREWVVEAGAEYWDEHPRRLRRRFVLHGSDDDIPAEDRDAGWTVDNISECMRCTIDALLDTFAADAAGTYDYLTSDSQVWWYLCENDLFPCEDEDEDEDEDDEDDEDDDEEENDDEC